MIVAGAVGLGAPTLQTFSIDSLPLAVAYAADRTSPPSVGETAPEIKLGDQHGKAFVLAETLEQREFVVVAFYPKAFTGG